jgi:hypothetical protein
MNIRTVSRIIVVLGASLLLVACFHQPEIIVPRPIKTITATMTSTPLPTDTQTPTFTFTPTIDVLASNVLLQDDFIDNDNGWLIQNDQIIKSKIIGARYILTIDCPPAYKYFSCGSYIQVPKLSSKNLQLELDATIEKKLPNTDVQIIFQFRRSGGNYYNIHFGHSGKYNVNIVHDGTQDRLLEDLTIPGYSPDTANRYGFYTKDTKIKPLFNGQELTSVEDGTINQAGLIYIVISVSRGGSAIVELDNFLAIDK